MIANFFRHLEQRGIRYLLISGQATILYGAATFSEDIDIWVEPDDENLRRLLDSLRACAAVYYKLTPPVTREHAERGHDFHFVIPSSDKEPSTFLDMMGRPPRFTSFVEATQSGRVFETAWGSIPVIGIQALVEIKKTQRPEDYPIISRLALAFLSEKSNPTPAECLWAIDNVFAVGELRRLMLRYRAELADLTLSPLLARALDAIQSESDWPPELEDEIDSWQQERASRIRQADRRYLRTVIEELRELRKNGSLMLEGTPV